MRRVAKTFRFEVMALILWLLSTQGVDKAQKFRLKLFLNLDPKGEWHPYLIMMSDDGNFPIFKASDSTQQRNHFEAV